MPFPPEKELERLFNRMSYNMLRDWFQYCSNEIDRVNNEITARWALRNKSVFARSFNDDSIRYYEALVDALETERTAFAALAAEKGIQDIGVGYVDEVMLSIMNGSDSRAAKQMAEWCAYDNYIAGRAVGDSAAGIINRTLFQKKEVDPAMWGQIGEAAGLDTMEGFAEFAAQRAFWAETNLSGLYRNAIIGKQYDIIEDTERIVNQALIGKASYSDLVTQLANGPYSRLDPYLQNARRQPTGAEILRNAQRAAREELHSAMGRSQAAWAAGDPDLIAVEFNVTDDPEEICQQLVDRKVIRVDEGEPIPITPDETHFGCKHFIENYYFKGDKLPAAA